MSSLVKRISEQKQERDQDGQREKNWKSSLRGIYRTSQKWVVSETQTSVGRQRHTTQTNTTMEH